MKPSTKPTTAKQPRWIRREGTTDGRHSEYWTCTPNLQIHKVVKRSGGCVFTAFEASDGDANGDARWVRGTCPTRAQAQRLALAPPCWKCGFRHLLRLQPHPWSPYHFRIRCNGDLCDNTQPGESSEFRLLDEALTRWEDLPNVRARELKRTQLFVIYLGLFVDSMPVPWLMCNYLYGPTDADDELQQFVFEHRRPGLERQGTMAIAILEAARALADTEHHAEIFERSTVVKVGGR